MKELGPATPEIIIDDVMAVREIVGQLTERYRDNPTEVQGNYSRVTLTQPVHGPHINVIEHEVLPQFGFNTAVQYKVGGVGLQTTLWAKSLTGEDHSELVFDLGTEVRKHPLYNLLSKASYGDCNTHVRNGQKIWEISDENPMVRAVAPRAFMLAHLNGHIRGHIIRSQDVQLYLYLQEIGFRALGFEEMAGLAIDMVRDTLDSNPALKPN